MSRKGFRRALAIAGVAAITMAGSAALGSAALPRPAQVADIQPAAGQLVGVAQPVVIAFTGPVPDRLAAQRAIEIDAPGAAPTGSFSWLNDRVVQYNPSQFWPAHAQIGVVAGGVKSSFGTGAAVVGVADVDAHTFTVSIDGQVVRDMPASMGKPRYPTPLGTFTALSKERNVTFDSRTIGIPLSAPDGYLIKGEYAVRVTWGGVYVHSAPWSVGSQGSANVSHGCINLSPDNAAWYFDTVQVGDPIIVQT